MRRLADQADCDTTGLNEPFRIRLPSVLKRLLDRVVTKHKGRLPVLRLAPKEIGKTLVFCGETQKHVARHWQLLPLASLCGTLGQVKPHGPCEIGLGTNQCRDSRLLVPIVRTSSGRNPVVRPGLSCPRRIAPACLTLVIKRSKSFCFIAPHKES